MTFYNENDLLFSVKNRRRPNLYELLTTFINISLKICQ